MYNYLSKRLKKEIVFLIIILAGILLISSCSNTNGKARVIKNFNDGWFFIRLDDEYRTRNEIRNPGDDWLEQYNVEHVSLHGELSISGDKLADEFRYIEDADWDVISLPHTPKIEDLTIINQWQGISYYKKTFDAPKTWEGGKCLLEFEGAMHLADIWINGTHVLQNAGGYNSFVVNITNHLDFNSPNEILVRLDNANNHLIPPGKPVEDLDFLYYGGIYRNVNLILKNEVHITHPILSEQVAGGGVFVTYPEVTEKKAVVSVKTHLQNSSEKTVDVIVRQRLISIDGIFQKRELGEEVALVEKNLKLSPGEDKHLEQIIDLENPRLWSPDEPYLYSLKTEIIHEGLLLDNEEHRIGIRHINFTRQRGFEINGQKISLVGSNRHMEYPYIGNAISKEAHYRDIYHIKESGFNTVRLGHYPQDKSVLSACDELGLLVIEPIPGWQFFNDNELFVELSYRDIRHMIRRGRNHPSVILWEVILNEAWPPAWWKDKAVETAHNEYPTDQMFTAGDSYGYYGFDVLYNDWEEGFNRPNNTDKPGFIREYYDFEFGGNSSSTRVARGDGERALLQNAWNAQWSHNRYRAYYPWTTGDAVWSMYDYNRGYADDICRSGVADLFRLDKFSIPFFKSQMPVGYPLPSGNFDPYIYLATFWSKPTHDNKVVVFANVEEVEIFVNGKKVARQFPDNGPDSDYSETRKGWYTGGNPFDGGNCLQLNSPPFTFNNILWQPGEIKAVGYINGEIVYQHAVKTPGRPQQITIDYFESGKVATTNDFLIVYVHIEDENGTLCIEDSLGVSLAIDKGGKIIGPSKVNAEAGIASFLIQTNNSSELVLKATTDFANVSKAIRLNND